MAKTKRLFEVTVVHNSDDSRDYSIEAKDDVVARAKAIPKYIKDFNAAQDRYREQDDRASWSSGDAPLNAATYKHITEKDVEYCETKLLNEWIA